MGSVVMVCNANTCFIHTYTYIHSTYVYVPAWLQKCSVRSEIFFLMYVMFSMGRCIIAVAIQRGSSSLLNLYELFCITYAAV